MALLNIKTLSKDESKLAITIEQAKAHCFIVEDDTTQDSILADFISTAQSILEGDSNMPYCFYQQEYLATFIADKERVLLPKSPVVSISKVEVENGIEWTTLDNSQYDFEQGDDFDFVVLKSYKRGNEQKIRITFTAGNDTIRKDVQIAVAQLVAHLYEYRGMTTTQQVYDNSIYKHIVGRLKRISF